MDSCRPSADRHNIVGRWVQFTLPIVVIIIIVASIFLFLPQPKPSQASPELSVTGAARVTYPGGETTYTWGPYHLPAAGNKAHNQFGIHTMMHDCVDMQLHLEEARAVLQW